MSAQRPRWLLHVQAQFWRVLMGIGMILHRLAPPRPPTASFTRTIPTTLSPRKGQITLHFYVPRDFEAQKRLRGKRYPCVVNFHGGGFTLGTAADDARWCKTVLDEVGAVVVSVDYRLAPEHPFPTAVEDGVDSILWIAQHAEELCIDTERIAVSGFSSGGNMSFTVPLRLQGEVMPENEDTHSLKERINSITSPEELAYLEQHAGSSTDDVAGAKQTGADPSCRPLIKEQKEVRLKAIVAWYPSLDYTQTREQRRNTCSRKDHNLPAVFTELFDESYLQPPTMDMANPFLSPGVAPSDMLALLPDDIILFTCEWDMLLAEGERFRDRLRDEIGKSVRYHMVPEVPHGWDKAPNPIRPPNVQNHYITACRELKRVFRPPGSRGSMDGSMRRSSRSSRSSRNSRGG